MARSSWEQIGGDPEKVLHSSLANPRTDSGTYCLSIGNGTFLSNSYSAAGNTTLGGKKIDGSRAISVRARVRITNITKGVVGIGINLNTNNFPSGVLSKTSAVSQRGFWLCMRRWDNRRRKQYWMLISGVRGNEGYTYSNTLSDFVSSSRAYVNKWLDIRLDAIPSGGGNLVRTFYKDPDSEEWSKLWETSAPYGDWSDPVQNRIGFFGRWAHVDQFEILEQTPNPTI